MRHLKYVQNFLAYVRNSINGYSGTSWMLFGFSAHRMLHHLTTAARLELFSRAYNEPVAAYSPTTLRRPLCYVAMFFRPRSLLSLAAFAGLATAWNVTVLPLGDSITYGWESTDGNGYREGLLALVQADGNTLDYIGSIQAGSMVSVSHCAYSLTTTAT